MASISLYIDIARNVLITGGPNLNPTPAVLPALVQGDVLNLQIYLVQPTGGIPAYSIVNNAGLSLQVAIGDKVGNNTNYYATQFVWTADPTNSFFYAAISLNTAAITALLGANPTAASTFEVKYIAGGVPSTALEISVTINAAVIKAGGVGAPPAGLTAVSLEYCNATFLPRQVQGAIVLVSPDGTKKVALYVDNDGAVHQDPLN